MPTYEYDCILGDLHFDGGLNLIKRPRGKPGQLTAHKRTQIRHSLHHSRFYADFVSANLKKTTKQIEESSTPDLYLVQTSEAIADLQRMTNIAANRLREWLGYLKPELGRGDLQTLLSNARGSALKRQPFAAQQALGELLDTAHRLQKTLEASKGTLDVLCEQIIPNVTVLCGPQLAAKLLAKAGSLHRFARMPASTIQTLGAEAALFRHLRTRARPPKHGILFEHPLVAKVKRKDRGKVARELANKIALAARVDRFEGKPIGAKLKKDLEKRWERW